MFYFRDSQRDPLERHRLLPRALVLFSFTSALGGRWTFLQFTGPQLIRSRCNSPALDLPPSLRKIPVLLVGIGEPEVPRQVVRCQAKGAGAQVVSPDGTKEGPAVGWGSFCSFKGVHIGKERRR